MPMGPRCLATFFPGNKLYVDTFVERANWSKDGGREIIYKVVLWQAPQGMLEWNRFCKNVFTWRDLIKIVGTCYVPQCINFAFFKRKIHTIPEIEIVFARIWFPVNGKETNWKVYRSVCSWQLSTRN